MVKNAFGWWDREYDGLNHKSKVLGEFPFNSSPLWGNVDTSKKLNTAEIEEITVNGSGVIVKSDKFTFNEINTTNHTVSLVKSPSVVFAKADWNGLIESKGSLLCFAFLVSVFDLKGNDTRELEVVNPIRKLVQVRSGLRDCEKDAPPLLPFQLNQIEVANTDDIDTRNMVNPFVCGVSRVCDNEASKNIILRLPFYYNRGGRSWNKAQYICDAWMPNNVNCHVQYGYLACGLWAVGDVFFDPEL
jgi:hypothetical protein